MRAWILVQARIFYKDDGGLECHTVLEDGDFVDTCNLIVGVLAIGNSKNLGSEVLDNFVHALVFYQDASIEVNPIWLALIEARVGADLHSGYEGAKWCATTRGEEYNLAACCSESCCCNEIIARSGEQVETIVLDTIAILHHTTND